VPTSAPNPSPAPTIGGRRRDGAGDQSVRLARTEARALVTAAVVAALTAVGVAVLVITGGTQGIVLAAILLVVVAVLLGVIAGYLAGALWAHSDDRAAAAAGLRRGGAADASDSTAWGVDTDRGEAVTDEEIDAARAMFGTGTSPVPVDPSWLR
jgi:hypothetical protein